MDAHKIREAQKQLTERLGAVDPLVSLRWSKETPVCAGWYWWKNHHGVARVEQVLAHPELPEIMVVMENSFMGWRPVRVNSLNREWAGPIPEPQAS